MYTLSGYGVKIQSHDLRNSSAFGINSFYDYILPIKTTWKPRNWPVRFAWHATNRGERKEDLQPLELHRGRLAQRFPKNWDNFGDMSLLTRVKGRHRRKMCCSWMDWWCWRLDYVMGRWSAMTWMDMGTWKAKIWGAQAIPSYVQQLELEEMLNNKSNS